jgi:adenine-specific DNA-methyltransferase
MLLDAFAGMGAVAESLADQRQVWTNDVQHFAHLASACRLADEVGPLQARKLGRMAKPLFSENARRLHDQNSIAIKLGRKAINAPDYLRFRVAFERAKALPLRSEQAYGCFTRLYSHGYFSLEQCTEIDSIRFALEALRGRGEITFQQFDWGLVALGRAALRIANTTGHFAQYLTPGSSNFKRVIKQFQKSIWKEWLVSIRLLQPVGSAGWRKNNLATRSDSTTLLRDPRYSTLAKVVYCDPPYTDDQYSRYYHVWETLVLYDYPSIAGQGRYRPNRFTTDFSLASKVERAFRQLITDVATTGADLVVSYPSDGLLHRVGACPFELIREKYPTAKIAKEISHRHSTMGASKGPAKANVMERIYVGTF